MIKLVGRLSLFVVNVPYFIRNETLGMPKVTSTKKTRKSSSLPEHLIVSFIYLIVIVLYLLGGHQEELKSTAYEEKKSSTKALKDHVCCFLELRTVLVLKCFMRSFIII